MWSLQIYITQITLGITFEKLIIFHYECLAVQKLYILHENISSYHSH